MFSGPFAQGTSGGPGGPHKNQLGSGNLPGNLRHSFEGPDFPPAPFNLGDSFPSTSVHAGCGEPHGIDYCI